MDKKLYVSDETLSVQDNEKLLQQLKTGFKTTFNWSKYQSEPTLQTRNRYLIYFTDLSFQGSISFLVLLSENDVHQRSYKRYFLSTVKIKDYNVIIDGKIFLISQ